MEHRMKTTKLARRWSRPARDFLAGLAVFAVIAAVAMIDNVGPGQFFASSAHARLLEYPQAVPAELAIPGLGASTELETGAAVPVRRMASVATLALAFAGMFALNLWFARQLRIAARSRVRAARRQQIQQIQRPG